MADKSNLVHVDIFGQSYALRAGEDPAYIERIAGFVDKEMSEVGKLAGSVDSSRIAVLAALNIADQLFQARSSQDGAKLLEGRATRLAQELASVLGE
jgi:cell division protein ZapA